MSKSERYLWDPSAEPDAEIVALENALKAHRYQPVPRRLNAPRVPDVMRIARTGLLVAASIMVVVATHTAWINRPLDPWSLTIREGVAAIGARALENGTQIKPGEELSIGNNSRARLAVGSIGDVEIGPNSTLRIVDDGSGGHRIALQRGEIHARIWAPPRFFVVETPSATAVDLGCIYTLRIDENGNGSIEVHYGAVELVRDGRRVFVPAGVAVSIAANGPGIPAPMQTSPTYRAAADSLIAGTGDSLTFATALGAVDAQSSITLWHLVPHVSSERRSRLVDRIAQLVPLTAQASAMRDRVVALDSSAMHVWQQELQPRWSSEKDSAWRRFLVKWRLAKPLVLLQLSGETQ